MASITLYLILVISITSAFAFSNTATLMQLRFNAYQIIHRNQYYRLLSHALVHGNWEHLIVNMIVLYSFGTAVEKYFAMNFGPVGSNYFIALFLGGTLFSSAWSLIKERNNPYYNAVGASGAISAILFAAILFDPRNEIYFFGILPIPGFIFGPLYLYYSYYMSTKKLDNIGHDAHFLGAIFGFFFPILVRPTLLLDFVGMLINIGR